MCQLELEHTNIQVTNISFAFIYLGSWAGFLKISKMGLSEYVHVVVGKKESYIVYPS